MIQEGELRSELREENKKMAECVTEGVIAVLLNDASPKLPSFDIQVLNLTSYGTDFAFTASDGKMKLGALLISSLASVTEEDIQNVDILRVFDYSVMPGTAGKHFLLVGKCEVLSTRGEIAAEIESENESEVKSEEGFIFSDEEVFSISEGTFETLVNAVQNDCVLTVDECSEVKEEASNEVTAIPETEETAPDTEFSFVPIDQLQQYVDSKNLVDVIGVVLSVVPAMSFRRNQKKSISMCDITIADDTENTVLVSLLNDDVATEVCKKLVGISDTSPPVVAIKSFQVGEFRFGDIRGICLTSSLREKSIVVVNPEIPKSSELRSWYEIKGKEVNAEISPTAGSGTCSIHTDSPPSTHVTSFGEGEEGHAFQKKLKSETSAPRLF